MVRLARATLRRSKVVNHITGQRKLRGFGRSAGHSVDKWTVISGTIIGVLKTKFRPKRHRAPQPEVKSNQMLRVLGGNPGALPANIINEFVAYV